MRPPDITSGGGFAIDEDGKILAPVGIMKGVGSKAVEDILAVRKSGVFLTISDFKERVNRRLVNIRVQALLVRAGAFETLGWREPDPEKRAKDFAELLPIFSALPSLSRKTEKIVFFDQMVWSTTMSEARVCAAGLRVAFCSPGLQPPR